MNGFSDGKIVTMLNKILTRIANLFKANRLFIAYVCRHYWPVFLLQTATITLSGFSAALVSKISKLFIDSIIVNKSLALGMRYIVFWMSYMLLMNIVQHFATTYTNYAFSKAQIIVKSNMSTKISNLRLSFFDEPKNQDSLSRAIKYSETGGTQLLNYFFSLLTNVVAIISIVCVLTPFAWWIVFYLVILTVYKTVIETIVSKKNYEFQKKKTLLNRKISYFGGLFSNPSVILDLNIYNAFRFFFSKYEKEQNQNINLNKSHSVKINIFNILALLSIAAQNLILYFYIGYELINGRVSVADFTLFFTAVNYFNSILNNFRKSFSQFVPMALEAQNYTEFIHISDKEQYLNEGSDINFSKVKIDCIKTIEFQNVSFKYPLKDKYILKNISFEINSGEIISLVGRNGAGKTTLIKLLLGLYIPTSGQILVNSIPMEKINILSYWNCCGTMFQNFNVYAMSAYENITFDELKEYDISDILIRTDLKGVLEQQDKGVDTELSRAFDPTGVMLSGGETQKIAFARLCFYNRDLLVLDEPSSTLDAKSENEMFTFVDDMCSQDPNRIVLFVSHKLSSSIRADKILFINNGTLSHVGDHHYMMDHCFEYKELFLMQAKNYIQADIERS